MAERHGPGSQRGEGPRPTIWRPGRALARPVAIAASLATMLSAGAAPAEFAPECLPAEEPPSLTVGVVECQQLESAMLGGTTAFSYYIPPGCDPALGRECPVLYYLHGTGGSYREGTGARGSAGNAWVRALTHGPPVDPRTIDDPWRYADTATWVVKPPLDMVLVSPHGLTLPGGYGPAPDQNPFWMDWNPRYAEGGDQPRYDTPPPRFESHLVEELVPYVDRWFPTDGTREQRAMVGYSMGGIGAFHVGLKHPDTFVSLGMRSGPTLPSPVLAGEDAALGAAGVAPPVPVAYVRPPGPIAGSAPELVWTVIYGSVATVGYGDLAADHVWWRHNQPADLASNARARSGDRQSIHLKYFVNDAIPRRAEEIADPDPFAQFFETIIYPTNLWLDSVFERFGVERTFHVGPGDHSGTYAVPYFREQIEEQYANLRHHDGGGDPPPPPEVFDYRTIRTGFAVWGWRFEVEREPVEFLDLTDVSCGGLTLRGSGRVTVTVPAECGTGAGGEATFAVDLGPAQATDEPLGAGTSRAYGRTVTIALETLE